MTPELSTVMNRRRILQTLGATGAVALAGCVGGTPSAEDAPSDEEDDTEVLDEETATQEETADSSADVEDDEPEGDETEREFVDMTGQERLTVSTRQGGADESAFVFDPAFVRVDAGTTIEWENTGGGFHTVTSTDTLDDRSGGGDEFNATISNEGDSFEWTAEEPGTQHYYCSPHAVFMFGSIEIV